MFKTSDKLREYQRLYWHQNKERCMTASIELEERCRREREEYAEECAKKTWLSVKQVKKLQNEGWAIKEIMAWHRKYWVFNPQTLIFI